MKNKKNTYILLAVVLFIWGAVIYQFFSFSGEAENTLSDNHEFNVKPLQVKEKDTFSIDVRYRDPFLGKMYVENKTNTVKNSDAKASKTKVKEEVIDWPNIVYKGIVSDTKDKIKIYMLIISGKTCLMKKGETQEGIFLKDGTKESVYVKYKGNLNIILLQE